MAHRWAATDYAVTRRCRPVPGNTLFFSFHRFLLPFLFSFSFPVSSLFLLSFIFFYFSSFSPFVCTYITLPARLYSFTTHNSSRCLFVLYFCFFFFFYFFFLISFKFFFILCFPHHRFVLFFPSFIFSFFFFLSFSFFFILSNLSSSAFLSSHSISFICFSSLFLSSSPLSLSPCLYIFYFALFFPIPRHIFSLPLFFFLHRDMRHPTLNI